MLEFGKTSYTDFVLARNEILRLVGAPTESLSLIIIYYTFEYAYGIKITLLESLRSQKSPIKARFWKNWSKGLSCCVN